MYKLQEIEYFYSIYLAFMIRYKSSRQLSISEFKMPFEAKLDENNGGLFFQK